MRRIRFILIIVFLLVCTSPALAGRASTDVRVTFYLPTGNVMRSGIYPYYGAAACSPDLSAVAQGEYRRFLLDGRIYQCLDTGGGVLWRHVDLFCNDWGECRFLLWIHGEQGTIYWLD